MNMSTRKDKRVRRLRGSRTHGYGRIGQHRKGGQRGGKGKTGGKKHDWTYVTAHDPERFGKHGFHRHNKLRQDHATINVGDITRNLPRFTEGQAPAKDTPLTIDLAALGYDKVLGAGRISVPLTISAPLFTHRAAEKIKAAGGKIKGTVQEPTKHLAPSMKEAPKAAPKRKPKRAPKTKAKRKTSAKAKPKKTTKKKPKRATATKGKA
jgi:large subunit ribosomal protein L15